MEIIDQYLSGYLKPEAFETVLADDAKYMNPISSCEGRSELVSALTEQARQCKELDIQKIFVKDNEVCAIYDFVSVSSPSGKTRVVDLIKIENGKIQSIDQTFDATAANRRNCEI